MALSTLKKWLPSPARELLVPQYRAAVGHLRVARAQFARKLSPLPVPNTPELYVHLGCGGVNHPKFVNVDAVPFAHVHHVRPIEDLSPFADGSAALVYACHCLEHFPIAVVPAVLREWYRVLRSGGMLRVCVPDFDKLVAAYRDQNNTLSMQLLWALLGGQDSDLNFHLCIFNERYLTELFGACGFREVRLWEPGSSDLTTFDDWSRRKLPVGNAEYDINLNLEALK